MAVDERTRQALARRLEAVLGPDDASALMEYLRPVGWADIATKQDLHALEQRLRGGMGELRGEMGELRGEIGELRGELRGEIRAVRGELGKELADALRAQTNRILAWVVPTMMAGVGLAIGATSLG